MGRQLGRAEAWVQISRARCRVTPERPVPVEPSARSYAVLLKILLHLREQPVVEGQVLKAAIAPVTTESEAKAKLEAANRGYKAVRQRVLELDGIIRELVSFENATSHRHLLVQQLDLALQSCRESQVSLARCKFPQYDISVSKRGIR